jgi:hypothetical protein
MMKVALYCPRLPDEAEERWKTRYQACCAYLRSIRPQEAVEFDTLEYLQLHYPRFPFRRVLVAHLGYYPQAFWDWIRQNRIPVLDVMTLNRDRERTEQPFADVSRR